MKKSVMQRRAQERAKTRVGLAFVVELDAEG
jgi:hypothetical protein